VITDTLFGLVAFAAAAGPGYLYVRLAERREPRRDRSQLQEAAELVFVGVLATAIGLLGSLALWEAVGLIDGGSLSGDLGHYLLAHPMRGFVVLATALTISYAGVWMLVLWVFGATESIYPDDSAWYSAFRRQAPKDHGVLVTLTLGDGRAITGALSTFTIAPDKKREILLNAPENRPIFLQDVDGVARGLPDAFIVVQGTEIQFLSGRYEPA
jgi:hypothetical protein